MSSINYLLQLLLAMVCLNLIGTVYGEKVKVVELTSGWRLKNQNGSIEVPIIKIPSGVYSALSELYGDLLHSYNDTNLNWIAQDNWTYINVFNVQKVNYLQVRFINLTLHGIDTVAEIRLNNAVIGNTNNMFVRYSFNIKSLLREENILEIRIKSPINAALEQAALIKSMNVTEPRASCPSTETEKLGACHRNLLRKMQMSFGVKSALVAPSMGICTEYSIISILYLNQSVALSKVGKPVTLEYYDVAIMRDVDVALQKNNTHWILDIRTHLSSELQQNFFGQLTLYGADLLAKPINIPRSQISFERPMLEFQHVIPVNQVVQWWPNGYGAQQLYALHLTMNCWLKDERPELRAKTVSSKSLYIGFRTIELVEDVVESGRTFLFKVNGVEIFMKGAIYMPAHILPELAGDESRIRHLLKSAKTANMNMIRVWAGGIYESDYFYSMADYYGLLVWQDMPFTSATYPVTQDFVESVRLETRQNAQRLAYHPSLALFVTNDEIELALATNKYNTQDNKENYINEYKELFVTTIPEELEIIYRKSFKPRPRPLRSTPSNGRKELSRNMTESPQNADYGDVHIMNVLKKSWRPSSYPRPRFVSAYGFPSLPIMPSWNHSMNANDNLSEVIKHRQHLVSDVPTIEAFISTYIPMLSPKSNKYLESLVYFSQIVQALAAKLATELFRSQRSTEHKTMGALYWQLNDVWVAPTCASIDYYGNYKILYYWSKEFLAPTSIIALYDAYNKTINVTLVRDEINVDPEVFDVTMNMYLWSDLYPKKTITWQAILRQNDSQLKQLGLDLLFTDGFNVNNTFLEFVLSASKKVLARTFFFPSTMAHANGISDPELSYAISWKYCNAEYQFDMKIVSYSLTIKIKRPALFVYIELNHPDVKNYKLSENGYMQVEPVKIVHLEFAQTSDCITITRAHIKVIALNQFVVPMSTITRNDSEVPQNVTDLNTTEETELSVAWQELV